MKTPLLVLPVLLLSLSLQAAMQTDSLQVGSGQNRDSEKAMELLIRADSIALADSLNSAVLIRQLEGLRMSERSKREEIERELEKIRRRDSLQQTQLQDEILRLKDNAVGYPIVIHKDTLFSVYTRIGSMTSRERATVLTERLDRLYREFFVKTDSLFLVNTGQSVDLYFKDRIILSVTELDALWQNRDKTSIAQDYRDRILADIAQYKVDRSVMKVLKEIGLVLVVILVLVGLIRGINYLFRARVNKFLWSKRGKWFKGIKIKNNEIINDSAATSAVLFLAKLFRFALIFLLIYLTLPVLFSIFPLTQRFAESLFDYILNPLVKVGRSFLDYIPSLITIVVIVFITRYVIRFLRFLSEEVEREKFRIPGFYPDWAKPTYNIIKMMILAFMFVVIFPYLPGSDSQIFKGVSVFIGVLFTLGSSSIIGNLIAGLIITYMRPFQIGDRIKIGEIVGNVVEKTPFVTRIRTPKKESITVPNTNILLSNVVNYSNSKQQGGLILHTTVTIGYDVPWRKVHQILIGAAKKTGSINLDIAPFVLQTSLDDFYVSYQLNVHTNEPDRQPAIYSEIHQNIQDGFNEAGIEILSPHYRAARDGNPMAIPRQYLPEDYVAPGFKVEGGDARTESGN
ncbi:MAG: mechanosensitive ion channel [Bacteroidales bacterium]